MSAITTYVKDLIERVGATFLEAALGAFGAAILVNGLSIEAAEVAAIAGIAATAALVKGWLAKLTNKPDTASLAPGV